MHIWRARDPQQRPRLIRGALIPGPLVWLSAGAFALGTESYVIAGILPVIASDLGVSVAAAGQLVAFHAITLTLASPLSAMLTSRWERKTLLTVALGGCAASNLLATVAWSYEALALARVLQAMSAGSFMPAASAYAASSAQPDRKARTIGMILLGNTLATLIGAPLGTVIGHEFGWRMTFLAVAAATMVAFAGIVMALPRLPGHDAATLADRVAVARRPDVIAVLLVTLLGTIGSFSVYTYLAPFLQGTVGFSGHAVAGVLLLFGLSGLAGNVGGGIALDRWGPRLVLTVVLSIMAAALATLSLAPAAVESRVAAIVCCSAIAVWSAFGWSFPIGQQTRLVSLEPSLRAIALSLNWSATALGVSIGAALGGVVVAHGAISAIGWLGATFQILALVALLLWPVHPGARSGLRIPS